MAKKSSNDQTILALKKQIEEKKSALAGSDRFRPVTNCSLRLDGESINLNACDSGKLTVAMVKLNALRLSEKDLGIGPISLDGFSLEQWIADCKAKLMVVNRQAEEARLKVLEAKLHDLLSAETKTELLISDIKNLL